MKRLGVYWEQGYAMREKCESAEAVREWIEAEALTDEEREEFAAGMLAACIDEEGRDQMQEINDR